MQRLLDEEFERFARNLRAEWNKIADDIITDFYFDIEIVEEE